MLRRCITNAAEQCLIYYYYHSTEAVERSPQLLITSLSGPSTKAVERLPQRCYHQSE